MIILSNNTCREEILQTVKFIINEKGVNEFTVKEVVQYMTKNNTTFKESTIKTHITSRCCSNSPQNHPVVYNDFKRIKPGLYMLLN